MHKTRYWVVIPAAGQGQRFGSSIPKQYLNLCGKTIIEHTLAKFIYHPRIEKVVVAINSQDYYWQRFHDGSYNEKVLTAVGGNARFTSVFSALQLLAHHAQPHDFVLVHDAVRPCITHSDIDKLITTVGEHPVGGILGTKVRDTLKYANDNNQILNTVARENIWQALTPQMFRYKLLTQALQECIAQGNVVTDEACAIESLGLIPLVVEGRSDNIKITYSEDLFLAEKSL